MSIQTARFREQIDAAKTGDVESLYICRSMVRKLAESEETPDEALIAMSEAALDVFLKQCRDYAEQN